MTYIAILIPFFQTCLSQLMTTSFDIYRHI